MYQAQIRLNSFSGQLTVTEETYEILTECNTEVLEISREIIWESTRGPLEREEEIILKSQYPFTVKVFINGYQENQDGTETKYDNVEHYIVYAKHQFILVDKFHTISGVAEYVKCPICGSIFNLKIRKVCPLKCKF